MLPPLCISQSLVYFLRKNTKHLALDFIIAKNEFDNVSTRVVIASLGIFRKAADQVLKYISHLYVVDCSWIQVELRERLHNSKQAVILVHLCNLLLKIQSLRLRKQNLLHIG